MNTVQPQRQEIIIYTPLSSNIMLALNEILFAYFQLNKKSSLEYFDLAIYFHIVYGMPSMKEVEGRKLKEV